MNERNDENKTNLTQKEQKITELKFFCGNGGEFRGIFLSSSGFLYLYIFGFPNYN